MEFDLTTIHDYYFYTVNHTNLRCVLISIHSPTRTRASRQVAGQPWDPKGETSVGYYS